jgi:hypothetical protein
MRWNCATDPEEAFMAIAATKTDTAPTVAQAPIAKPAIWPGMQLAQQACNYWVDAWQRSVLFLDVMRQRGNNYFERAAESVPNVLHFQFEPVMSGGDLPRPVNYGLVRILPPADVKVDPRKPLKRLFPGSCRCRIELR